MVNSWYQNTVTNYGFQYGTSAMKGSVMDRGTANGNYSQLDRYPKGVRANEAGTITLVDTSGGTCPFRLSAGEIVRFAWKAFVDSSLQHGSSNMNNFVILWD
jgi:hypothetical protein